MDGLDERKVKILDAIIRTYLETGGPVGSRTISKYTDLNLSSATIRNEMSDLEDLGYLITPHTSAGRIPSDKGYRFYVDHLLESKDKEISDMKDFVIEHTEKMEQVLKQVARMLAKTTNYATMISSPKYSGNKVKFIQLSLLDANQLLAVIVMEANVVKNKIIPLRQRLDNEALFKLNLLLNSTLNGLSIPEINLGIISRMKEQAGEYSDIVGVVLDAVAESISQEELEIYTSGATNIFKYPELSDSLNSESETGIQVYIGNESPIQTMKDCSVVTATYELSEGVKGTVGIIGPKRMDYERVMDSLKELKTQLDGIFRKPSG